MLPLQITNKLNKIKSSCLVVDLETSSFYPDGREINIKTNFDDYVQNAQVKWFGAFSFKNNKSYYINAITHRNQIVQLLKEHDVLIHFNGIEFDFPILQNNGMISLGKRYLQVDLWEILGTSDQKNRAGYKLKNRGELMNYDFANNSLRHMAEVMGLETQKGEIDYTLFHKNEWTEEEINEILAYLSGDINVEKEMFQKLWIYWLPFAELLDEKFVYDLSWMRNSIASVTYKAACRVLGIEPTYNEGKTEPENVGGNVLLPKLEEAQGVWCLDYASLYPHAFSMCNLHAEVKKEDIDKYEKVWHGNEIFQVNGYYDISEWHPLAKYIAEKLEEREKIKAEDETHPMVYTLKILLNSFYGASRSPKFEKIHTPNCGADCCRISQQIQKFTMDMFDQFGFETIYGDTDSVFILAREQKNNTKEYVQECINQIIDIIKEHAPFPIDTFKIKIEKYIDYIMWPFDYKEIVDKKIRDLLNEGISEGYEERIENKKKVIFDKNTNKVVKIGRSWVKERTGKKKSYAYIYEDKGETKIKLVGLPITKSNSTLLGRKIYNEDLKDLILQKKNAKFPRQFINNILDNYLKNLETIKLFAVEYKVKPISSYKILKGKTESNVIQAQISRAYCNGQGGIVNLIKNKKIGKAGLGEKYCTIDEALSTKLSIEDIDLERIMNELSPFIEHLDK